MESVKYTCKNCGWKTEIRAEWGDLRPKRCMNKKCNTSFVAKPADLIIERPTVKVEEVVVVQEEKAEDKKDGYKNNKRK